MPKGESLRDFEPAQNAGDRYYAFFDLNPRAPQEEVDRKVAQRIVELEAENVALCKMSGPLRDEQRLKQLARELALAQTGQEKLTDPAARAQYNSFLELKYKLNNSSSKSGLVSIDQVD